MNAFGAEVSPRRKPRILIVEDDIDLLRDEHAHFTAFGYEVCTAENEDRARSVFNQSAFDLVIVDLMMEHADSGIVLAHQFKKRRPTVPIIMVSDLTAETGMVFDLSGSGERRWIKVDRILAKPLRLERLMFEAELLLDTKSLGTSTMIDPHVHADARRLEI